MSYEDALEIEEKTEARKGIACQKPNVGRFPRTKIPKGKEKTLGKIPMRFLSVQTKHLLYQP